jgi:hypothetical protein
MADSYVFNNEFKLMVRLIANNLKAFQSLYYNKIDSYYSCIYNLTNKTSTIDFVKSDDFRKEYSRVFVSNINIKPINFVDFVKKILKKQYLL